ncbi:unnamed protein product, partial [Rotaria sp. Silwood1]
YPQVIAGHIYSVLNRRQGYISEERQIFGTSTYVAKAYLPISESLGFTDDLCSSADGQIVIRCVFHHWHISDEDPLDESTRIRQVVKNIRRRKGLKENIPSTNDYLDKL